MKSAAPNADLNNKSNAHLLSQHFHFIGIGGIGMCGIAEILHAMGARVSGSDMGVNQNTERLQKRGIRVYKGHAREHVQGASVVVYSSAVKPENEEFDEAHRLGIPLIPRAEALAEIMRLKRGIAIAGTHGKTTTTSLVSSIFLQADLNPTIAVGGRLSAIDSTARLGVGDWFIAEADESDGSFNKLNPEIAVITNIDSDHMDFYKNFENLKKAFLEFANRIPFYGTLMACGDDPIVRQALANYKKRVIFYGFEPYNQLQISGGPGTYQFSWQGKGSIGQVKLQMAGRHNALNSAAAIGVALTCGIEFTSIKKALESFSGVDRRLQHKGQAAGIDVFDDYGHHPTEVRATLQAFKEKYPDRRLVVYFQPHRYSRTKDCWLDFQNCFEQADTLILGPIYAAGEKPIEGISHTELAAEIKKKHTNRSVDVLNTTSPSQQILSMLKSSDVFLTLGAGDGYKLGVEILANLKER